MIQTADRLRSIEEYYFSKKLREVRGMVAAGQPIINIGIGSPDLPPSEAVINSFQESVKQAGAHQYQSYQGKKDRSFFHVIVFFWGNSRLLI